MDEIDKIYGKEKYLEECKKMQEDIFNSTSFNTPSEGNHMTSGQGQGETTNANPLGIKGIGELKPGMNSLVFSYNPHTGFQPQWNPYTGTR